MATPLQELVAGNRIFAHHSILDAYGHISIRDPQDPQRFIMSRARAPELVDENDLMTFDLQGQPLGDDKRSPYQERFIHAGIYAARPEVRVVCHSHTPSILPFGVTNVPLKAVFHMGAGIGESVPVWDIADEFGLTNMLVTNLAQGQSLARTLGAGRMALMRGHGCVFVASSVPELVRAGVYMDINAKAAAMAHIMSGGNVHYLSDDEVRQRAPAPAQPGQAFQVTGTGGREWEAWCAQVGIFDL